MCDETLKSMSRCQYRGSFEDGLAQLQENEPVIKMGFVIYGKKSKKKCPNPSPRTRELFQSSKAQR